MKTLIIACIGLSAIILNYLYRKNKDVSYNIKVLVLIEIIGNSLILVPTGGLNSPYVWYSINTILIAAILLRSLYCWINLFVYIFTSTCIVYLIFNNSQPKLTEFISGEANLILSLVLITGIIRQLAMYIKRLRSEGIKQIEINRQLNAANRKVRESVDYIMELYQTVYMFTALHDKEDIIGTIMEYSEKVTKADMIFFYCLAGSEKRMTVRPDSLYKNMENYLSQKIEESLNLILNSPVPFRVDVDDKSYLAASVRTNCIIYGVLGIEIAQEQQDAWNIEFAEQLKFMAGLSSIVFEKFEMEQVNERLVITEEQNRIANEIHDSVLQRLFSTSFGIHGLMRNIGNITDNELNKELDIIKDSINNAMKELRTAIYSMSFNKGGTDNFIVDAMKFIEETRHLNNVKINFKHIGNSEVLTLLQKKSLYRIICEGVGNAVRHSSAKHIDIMLHIQQDVVVLKITDDGTGFDLQSVKQSGKGGLGIKNIESMAHYLSGKVCIRSSFEKGTRIRITCPVYAHLQGEENIV
jgi:signal transduction histidine kinase